MRAEAGRFEEEPCPPWQLSCLQLKIVEERLSQLCIPEHLDVSCKYVFSHPSRLKSHDWKQVCVYMNANNDINHNLDSKEKITAYNLLLFNKVACQGILKYCLRDMLGPQQRQSLFKLLDAITEVLSERHDRAKLGELAQRLNVALALLERDFPRPLQV